MEDTDSLCKLFGRQVLEHLDEGEPWYKLRGSLLEERRGFVPTIPSTPRDALFRYIYMLHINGGCKRVRVSPMRYSLEQHGAIHGAMYVAAGRDIATHIATLVTEGVLEREVPPPPPTEDPAVDILTIKLRRALNLFHARADGVLSMRVAYVIQRVTAAILTPAILAASAVATAYMLPFTMRSIMGDLFMAYLTVLLLAIMGSCFYAGRSKRDKTEANVGFATRIILNWEHAPVWLSRDPWL